MNVGEDPLDQYNYGPDGQRLPPGSFQGPSGIYGALHPSSSYSHLPPNSSKLGQIPGSYSTGNLPGSSPGVTRAPPGSGSSSRLDRPYDPRQFAPQESPSPSVQSNASNHPIYSRPDTVNHDAKSMSARQPGPGPGGDNPYSTLGGYQRSQSPASSQGRGTPTRSHPYHDEMGMSDSLPPNANYPQPLDSFDQQYAYRDHDPYGPIPARDGRYGDQFRGTPPVGGEQFQNIPHIDDGHHHGNGDGYPMRGEDPYGDARPGENPYGRFHGDAHRQSPSLGHTENPYGSNSQFVAEGPYGHGRYGSEDHGSFRENGSLSGDPYVANGRGSYASNNRGSYAQDPLFNSPLDDPNPYGTTGRLGSEEGLDSSSRGSYALDDRNPYGVANHLQDRDIYGSRDKPLSYNNNIYEVNRQLGAQQKQSNQQQPGLQQPEEDPYASRSQVVAALNQDPYGSRSQVLPQDDPYGQINRSYADDESPYGQAGRQFPADKQFSQDGHPPDARFNQPYPDEDPNIYGRPRDSISRDDVDNYNLGAPFNPDVDDGIDDFDRRSPSISSQSRDSKWRDPDLPEVIDYLGHPTNSIKANAAAYLQHLCYNDDNVKAKARTLGAIPALVELVNNEIPEIHRAACGTLRNMSYGKQNDQCKKDIRNAGGIPALVRLLRKSPDNDVRELVTGILWNLSSCSDLKRPIIDDGLTVIVNSVLIPHSGWDRNMDEEKMKQPPQIYWSTVFRNASGILRNISSDGEYARKKLRECEGLVDAILHIVRAAIGKNDIDNKSVENCTCILRNLSYACQEVQDPEYLHRKQISRQQSSKEETTGCFGGNKKKKDAQKVDQRGRSDSGYQSRMRSEPPKGMELLWQPEVVHVYQPLLSQCSNPETLEAAAGAIQNLVACDWPPSIDIRATVRKERGLPIIVELLTVEADRVVCAAATALRNLALDPRNKELIGKYGMRQLVQKLPADNKIPDMPVSDDTITAVQATLYEIVKKNPVFALSLLNEGGVERLNHIINSRTRYSPKVVKFASSILYTMWQFKELHQEYKNKGFKEQHFITKTMAARGGPSHSANNTLNRPRMDLGGSGVNPNNQPVPNRTNAMPPGYMDDAVRTPDRDRYDRLRPDDIPMNQMGGSHDVSLPNYASVDQQGAPQGLRQNDYYRPPGGVPLFPNLMPANQPQPQVDNLEPLYAQVNKSKRQAPMPLDGVPPQDGGADSWV